MKDLAVHTLGRRLPRHTAFNHYLFGQGTHFAGVAQSAEGLVRVLPLQLVELRLHAPAAGNGVGVISNLSAILT